MRFGRCRRPAKECLTECPHVHDSGLGMFSFFFLPQWASSCFQVFQDESRLRIGVRVCVEGGKRTRRVRGTPSNSSCVSVIISSVREYPTCGVCNQGLKLILECHAARGNLLRYSLRFVVWSGTFKVTRWSGLILNNW